MDPETERRLEKLERLDRSRDDLLLGMAEMMITLTRAKCKEQPWWALHYKISGQLGSLMGKAERFAEDAGLKRKDGG